MPSITLHNLDPEIERAVRERAREQRTSLNRTIQRILKESLGLDKKPIKKCDFSDLAGTWTKKEALEFEKATGVFSKIDTEMWK